tara:strand:- start:11984 stop:12754 length:771 start_codon:yes stop_codon:yes gene_type:complete
MRDKSATDLFWDQRPISVNDPRQVNIDDLAQRKIENDFIFKYLNEDLTILEIGCGNGFLTSELRNRCSQVDSCDYSEKMILQAKEVYGEKNNYFFVKNILEPFVDNKKYDLIICVRVLINLCSIEEQKLAIENIQKKLNTNGKLLLLEGFLEGFNNLNILRNQIGISELKPASINYYSKFDEFEKIIKQYFKINNISHTGVYDYLTRIVYPCLVGPEVATGYSEFHEKILKIASLSSSDQFSQYARLKFLELIKTP